MFQNTIVKKGVPLLLYTNAKVRNCVFRNNLFIGTEGGFAYESTAPMQDCDFDYDGFGGGPYQKFLKWNNVRYTTFQDMTQKSPIEKHARLIDAAGLFASGTMQPEDETQPSPISRNDLRLKSGTTAVDAGEVLPGLNDGYVGQAPDLGAYELGSELPHYGPRP
jgi:hypothetical protein